MNLNLPWHIEFVKTGVNQWDAEIHDSCGWIKVRSGLDRISSKEMPSPTDAEIAFFIVQCVNNREDVESLKVLFGENLDQAASRFTESLVSEIRRFNEDIQRLLKI